MPTIEISNFSCIDGAILELAPITLLIGPQASGKSVITKLCYFFTDILQYQFDSASEGGSLDRFRATVIKRFEEWFPPSAWGRKDFRIVYHSGNDISYSITRSHSKRKRSAEIELEFSDFFSSQFNELSDKFLNLRKAGANSDDDDIFDNRYERQWRVRSSAMRQLSERLSDDFIRSQTFIPAGRSFFTNLGKAVAMLEHGKQLDEVTKRFGRLFTSLIDGRSYWYPDKPDEPTKEFLANQKLRLDQLFGGKIKVAENDRHVATPDGRKIPFSILSSGQQELLPLLLILQYKARHLAGAEEDKSKEIIYVEEPEAHLFPSAQGALVDYIAALSAFFRGNCFFLITTHSPYVLSKFNNLIKAFTVSALSDKATAAKVEAVVPKEIWLPPASVNAYALDGGNLHLINDKSGLIDGDYLDRISEDISETFLSLLEAQTDYDRSRMPSAQKQIEDQIAGER